MDALGVRGALGIGVAQAIALIPGISRSGISISGGLFAGLDRESAARFSFLMAAPVIAGAGLFEIRKVVAGEEAVTVQPEALVIGLVAALVAGMLAIHGLLRFLRSNPTHIFVAYRVLLAAVVVIVLLSR
jgi:undecaprenyl-diphosphatase